MAHAGGRPTEYKPEYVELVYALCLLGLTDEQLSLRLGITKATLNNWKHKYPEFFDSIKRGKECADDEVINALRTKALAGDTTACIFWLKNRQSQDWRDRKEIAVDAVDSPFGRFVTSDTQDGD